MVLASAEHEIKDEICGQGHHKILCEKFGRQDDNTNRERSQVNAFAVCEKPSATLEVQTCIEQQALIGTILIKIKAANGNYIIALAMVDDGSMLRYITQQMFQQLKQKENPTHKKF